MDADGNTTDVSVSEWLKNEGKSNNLSDYSNLKNIKNTSGDEKMSRDGNKLRGPQRARTSTTPETTTGSFRKK